MSIDIEMTGSGTLGPITPGWSVQESATPTTIGESASTSGSVSFTAATRDDSLLAINNYITTTHPDLGHVDGIVKSVSQQGLSTNITHSSLLSSYDAEADIPGLVCRKTYSGIDLITQLSKNEIRLKEGLTGGFWSLQGHNAGFDSEGNILEPTQSTNIDGFKWTDRNGNARNNTWVTAKNSINTSAVRILSNKKQYARVVWADTLLVEEKSRYYRVAFKTLNESNDVNNNVNWSWGTMSQDSLADSIRFSSFTLNKSSQTLDVRVDYVTAGLFTKFENSVNLSSLDWSKEMSVFFEFDGSDGILYAGQGYVYTYKITVCNSDNYSSAISYTKTIGADWFGLWHGLFNWQGGGTAGITDQAGALGVRSVWWRNDNIPFVIQDWENPQQFAITDSYKNNSMTLSNSNSVAVVGNRQNMWQWIQDMCASFGNTEIYVQNNVLTIGFTKERILDISNILSPPSISPNTTLSGKTVQVNYTNAVFKTAGSTFIQAEVYDAYKDNNRILKVNVGEVLTTTVETNYYINTVLSPLSSIFPVNVPGYYNVADANGFNVSSGWYAAGGRVFATKNKDNPYAIDIKVVGPAAAYGGYTPPFIIGLKAADKEYAALRLSGSGYNTNKKTLNLRTGATPEKTPTEIAKTIDNVWNTFESYAYDAGIRASLEASGPRVIFSGSIPTSNIQGFGLTPGSVFQYKDSIYRVIDCVINNVSVDFNAVRHVSVEDFDAVWDGKTVAQHDSVWASNNASDQIIIPLYQPL